MWVMQGRRKKANHPHAHCCLKMHERSRNDSERVSLNTPTVLTRNTLHFLKIQCDACEKRSTKDLKMRTKRTGGEDWGFRLRSNQGNDADTGGDIHDTWHTFIRKHFCVFKVQFIHMLVLADFLQSHFFCKRQSCNHKAFIICKGDTNGGLNLLAHKSD